VREKDERERENGQSGDHRQRRAHTRHR